MAASSRRWALRAIVCGLLYSLLPAACGVPEFKFEEAPNPDSGVSPRPRCALDNDCARYESTKICDSSGHCVECIAADEDGSQRCGVGLYCDVNRCAVGCAADLDCPAGLTCDVASHRCQDCTGDSDCAAGTACKDARCVPSCANSEECPESFQCCGGVCASLPSDPLHCGACSKACPDGQDCINGLCAAGSGCALGRADCDGKASNGCEADLSNDQQHCGNCQTDCSPGYCSGGRCSSIACPSGLADCDQEVGNGCEANLSSVESCGICSRLCSDIYGKPACSAGKCSIVCDAGFRDCDDNSDTGCETEIGSDAKNCGACGLACTNDNGSTRCLEGGLHAALRPGFRGLRRRSCQRL